VHVCFKYRLLWHSAIRSFQVACAPVGIPSIYTYYKWQYKSKYGVLIRELDGETNGVLTLPNISAEDTYQDSGEYVCIAGNGGIARFGLFCIPFIMT
jgi:hypothetical protein